MDINTLDPQFIENMREILGEEIGEFLSAVALPQHTKSLRVNNLKVTTDEFLKLFPYATSKSPFADNGFLLEDMSVSYGNTPQHIAGLFYMQEPSAMLPVTLIKDYVGERVLDLCAAPGGKTGQVADIMQGKGVLVANEVVFNRAKILRSNVERLGIRNCMVTSNFPADLARALPNYFDTIIVDSPCSGEGMLRKEPAVVQNWSMANVESCVARDLEILKSADELLQVGGYMVYSTCTLNKYENEGVILEFLKNGRYEVVKAESSLYDYAMHGLCGLDEAVRVFPHKSVGEGHFACLLHKIDGNNDKAYKYATPFQSAKNYSSELKKLWESIANIDYFGETVIYKDSIFVNSVDFPFAKGLNIVDCGVKVADIVKNRLEPHHNLITTLRKGEFANSVDYDWNSRELAKVIGGEVVTTDAKFRGYGTVTADGHGVALVKNVDGTLKNHFPKALRVKI